MKRLGALILALFVLLLSLESTIGMHFCHDVLVETSINHTLSSCCKKNLTYDQPVLSKTCCELAHFSLDFQDTVVETNDLELNELVADAPLIHPELYVTHHISKYQFISFKPPPESSHTPLHILFEQYLI